MKTIVCIGDSHTWGQGAGRFWANYNPPVMAGDHRQASFDPPYYVNLLRNYINGYTHSKCGEINKEKSSLIRIDGESCESPFISITSGKLVSKIEGSMFRLQFKCGTKGSKAEIILDGTSIGEICTFSGYDDPIDYKLWKYDGYPDREHILEIRLIGNGQLDLYRIDYYSGSHAVINSGVGSCDSGKYISDYWQHYVEEYRPHLLIMEGFSINDWIRGTSLEMYYGYLKSMFDMVKAWGGKSMLLTVSPILGNQIFTNGCPEYTEYIKASVFAAQKANVPIADAFKKMSDLIPEGFSEDNISQMLFEDIWHVNCLGHNVYFECILSLVEKEHLL